jgi:hypothetical protein
MQRVNLKESKIIKYICTALGYVAEGVKKGRKRRRGLFVYEEKK